MKTKILYLAIFTLFVSSCGSKQEEQIQDKKQVQYECPMNCTEEVFAEPGKCPVCEMDLVEISSN